MKCSRSKLLKNTVALSIKHAGDRVLNKFDLSINEDKDLVARDDESKGDVAQDGASDKETKTGNAPYSMLSMES